MIKKMQQKKRVPKVFHFHPLGAAFGSGFITGITSHLFNFFVVFVIMLFSFAMMVAVLNFEFDLPMVFSKKI